VGWNLGYRNDRFLLFMIRARRQINQGSDKPVAVYFENASFPLLQALQGTTWG
jgi:hypothetical protein